MKSTSSKLQTVLFLSLLMTGLCVSQSTIAQTKPPKYKAVTVELSIPGFGEPRISEIPLNHRFGGGGGGGRSLCSLSAEELEKGTGITNYSFSMSARNFRASQLVMVNLTLTLYQNNTRILPQDDEPGICLKERLYVGYDEVREVSLPHNVKVKLYLKPLTPPEKKPKAKAAEPVSEPIEPQLQQNTAIDDSQALNPDKPLFRIRMPVQDCVGPIQLFSHQNLGNFMGKGQF
ncbi:MAG: hypothetical protein HY774_22155 [Acidobacteria bacterium]|nr:hypothetical protein [Acidobacteriota bacterium]